MKPKILTAIFTLALPHFPLTSFAQQALKFECHINGMQGFSDDYVLAFSGLSQVHGEIFYSKIGKTDLRTKANTALFVRPVQARTDLATGSFVFEDRVSIQLTILGLERDLLGGGFEGSLNDASSLADLDSRGSGKCKRLN